MEELARVYKPRRLRSAEAVESLMEREFRRWKVDFLKFYSNSVRGGCGVRLAGSCVREAPASWDQGTARCLNFRLVCRMPRRASYTAICTIYNTITDVQTAHS